MTTFAGENAVETDRCITTMREQEEKKITGPESQEWKTTFAGVNAIETDHRALYAGQEKKLSATSFFDCMRGRGKKKKKIICADI